MALLFLFLLSSSLAQASFNAFVNFGDIKGQYSDKSCKDFTFVAHNATGTAGGDVASSIAFIASEVQTPTKLVEV